MARRAAASLAGRRMTLRVPDAQQPYEASREERRRVSARLSMAYRGEADFFVGGEDAKGGAGRRDALPARRRLLPAGGHDAAGRGRRAGRGAVRAAAAPGDGLRVIRPRDAAHGRARRLREAARAARRARPHAAGRRAHAAAAAAPGPAAARAAAGHDHAVIAE